MGKSFDINKEANIAKKNNRLFDFFKDNISNKNITITEVIEYAKNKQYHLIDAKLINEIGVFVSNLDSNFKNQNMWINLCEIASERNSIYANEICSLYYINEYNYGVVDIIKSLNYSKKMIELSNHSNEYKLTYAKVLFKNHIYNESAKNLLEYFDYISDQLRKAKDKEKISKLHGKLKDGIILAEKIINLFEKNVKNKIATDNILTEDVINDYINCLRLFVNNNQFFKQKNTDELKNKTYYLLGKCHEILDNFPAAMSFYATFQDKNQLYYLEAVTARKNLIINTLNKTLTPSAKTNPQENTDETLISSFNQDGNLVLPGNLIMSTKFEKYWKKGAEWFSSVQENIIDSEFKKSDEQLDKLIIAKKAEIEIIEKMGANEKLPETENALTQLKKAKNNLTDKTDELSSSQRKKYRRYKAERNFFNPSRSKKQELLKTLTSDIIEHRFNHTNESISPVELTGKSSRLFITSERVFQETASNLLPKEPMSSIPTVREKNWQIGYSAGKTYYGPIEKYKVNETEIHAEHRTDPKPQRLGDSFLPQHGTYDGDIYPFLRKLSQGDSEKEKIIATYFLRYGKTHQGISLEEVQALLADSTEDDVHHFNRISFLIMEKEQGQWHSEANPDFHLGMSVSQARCLILLEAGHLSLEDVFKNNVLFGVYSKTQINNYPEKVAEACRYIDDLYLEYLKTKNSHEYLSFFKKNIKENHTLALTRKQAHEDLKYVYGGESDTDGEGYDSDLSLS